MNLNLIKSDRFGNTPADIYSNGKDMYMTAAQLGECLEFSQPVKSISNLVNRNSYLKSKEFSVVTKLVSTDGKAYDTRIFTEDGIYEVTMLAKTEKAKEFRAWVRKLIKSIRREEVKVVPMTEYQRLTAETKQANARARQAAILLKIADKTPVGEYAQVLHSHAAAIIAGKPILPLPEVDKPTYSAEEIGKMFGISRQMVGRIANAHGLKKPEYGKLFYDKAAHSNKQVETFRYYDSALPEFKKLIKEV
jgi:prophage antirepressor-like protein